MARVLNVSVDISALERLANSLGSLDSASIGQAAMTAVNAVADETYDMVRPRMLQTINLPDAYLQERMVVKHATSPDTTVSASIIATGSKPMLTTLARYNALQLVTAAKSPRARGNPARGIPAGMKAAGVSVEVTRGSAKVMPGAFMMPLKNGSGRMGVFTRDGGKLKHRYGPSVYQMFNTIAGDILGPVGDTLADRVALEAEKLLEKALA